MVIKLWRPECAFHVLIVFRRKDTQRRQASRMSRKRLWQAFYTALCSDRAYACPFRREAPHVRALWQGEGLRLRPQVIADPNRSHSVTLALWLVTEGYTRGNDLTSVLMLIARRRSLAVRR